MVRAANGEEGYKGGGEGTYIGSWYVANMSQWLKDLMTMTDDSPRSTVTIADE